MRLIDADALKEKLEIDSPDPEGVDDWISIINKQPTVCDIEQIRAEIDSYCSDNRDRNDGLYIAMRIIDKHTK